MQHLARLLTMVTCPFAGATMVYCQDLNRRAYASYRAGVAMDRLLSAGTPAERHRAVRWGLAWFTAAAVCAGL